ncbi:hypothetical protein [Deinococcus cavernae]|nr:hypothetical protein [Deinococcus cavernae]
MHNYSRVSLINISDVPDGEHVIVMGRYERHLNGATLSQRGKTLDLLGEPFDWIPPDQCAVEMWGVILQGAQPRLVVHNARQVGDTSRTPEQPREVCVGDTVTLTARVTNYADQQVCCTAERQSYVLLGEELDERLYLVSGRVMALRPPTLRLISALPIYANLPDQQGEQP